MLRRRHRLPLHRIGVRQHVLHHLDAVSDRLCRAAGVLDRERAQQRALGQVLRAEQRADLVRLAAQAHDQHTGEVRVPRVAAERAAQQLHAFAVRVHAAAGAVRQRDDAVDARECGQRRAAEIVGDAARDRRRAIDRRQDADVVARRDATVIADDALERRRRLHVLRGLGVGAERVVAVERAHREVVQVDVLAGRDVPACEADDLVVALDRLALRDRARRDLVAGRHEPRDGDFLVDERAAADQLASRDDDVVVRDAGES